VTITPRSHLHSQSHESHLTSGNAKSCDGHLATCDDVYMHIKMKTHPLCNPSKLHEGIPSPYSPVQELTMAPSLHSDEFRYDTTSSCLYLCNLPQSQSTIVPTGNDDQEAHKAPGLLSTLCTQSCTLHVDMTGGHSLTPYASSNPPQSLEHSYNAP
jgi:hypothetical protein